MKKYRMSRVDTGYGLMYLIEVRYFFFWFELSWECSMADAEEAMLRHSKRRRTQYGFYNKDGKSIF